MAYLPLLPPYSGSYPWNSLFWNFEINRSIEPEWKGFFEENGHAKIILAACGDHTKNKDIQDIFSKWKVAAQELASLNSVSVGRFNPFFLREGHLEVLAHLNYYNSEAFKLWFLSNQRDLCPPPPPGSREAYERVAYFEKIEAVPVNPSGCLGDGGGLMPVSFGVIAYLFWDLFKNNRGGPSAGSGEGGKIVEFKKRSSGQEEVNGERIREAARIGVGALGVGIGGYLVYKIARSLIVGAINPPAGVLLFFSPV